MPSLINDSQVGCRALMNRPAFLIMSRRTGRILTISRARSALKIYLRP